MDIIEEVPPANLAFGLGLFILGIFVRVDATLGMVHAISQNRITLLKKKEEIKNNETMEYIEKKKHLKHIERLLKAFAQQLIIIEDRVKKQKQVIWVALVGCFFALLASFILFITGYATELYWLALALIAISVTALFFAGVFGYQEVGLTQKADHIMVAYLTKRENEALEEDEGILLDSVPPRSSSEGSSNNSETEMNPIQRMKLKISSLRVSTRRNNDNINLNNDNNLVSTPKSISPRSTSPRSTSPRSTSDGDKVKNA